MCGSLHSCKDPKHQCQCSVQCVYMFVAGMVFRCVDDSLFVKCSVCGIFTCLSQSERCYALGHAKTSASPTSDTLAQSMLRTETPTAYLSHRNLRP